MQPNTKPMFKYIFIVFFLFPGLFISAQDGDNIKKNRKFIIAFYNVENLFDTIDDPGKRDGSYLPDAKVAWNTERYLLKLNHLDQVLSSLDEDVLPAIIGLCEVENLRVLEDLITQPGLKKGKYEIIHFESPDERGIDNALLYRKNQFIPLEFHPVPVRFSFDPEDNTRDILYVKGVPKKARQDTLHIFVNHWPSRWGGREQSDPKRVATAEILSQQLDSILSIDQEAAIILMGDFNDEPADRSLVEVLQAEPVSDHPDPTKLYNLMYEDYLTGTGTIYWKDWDMFDQFIISGYLLQKSTGMVLTETKGSIFDPEWIMYISDEGEIQPSRTAGKSYYGGYSDHLPVYIILYRK